MIFCYILILVCYVYSLELPHRGDSNEYTQNTLMLEKLKKISLYHASGPGAMINTH